MRKIISKLIDVGILAFLFGLAASSYAQGLMTVPDVSSAIVSSDAELVQGFPLGGEYEYRYTISSPAASMGNIWLFKVDVSAKERTPTGFSRTFPVQGGSATSPMLERVEMLAPFLGIKGPEVLVVSQFAPSGWNGGLNIQGFLQFSAADISFAVGSSYCQIWCMPMKSSGDLVGLFNLFSVNKCHAFNHLGQVFEAA